MSTVLFWSFGCLKILKCRKFWHNLVKLLWKYTKYYMLASYYQTGIKFDKQKVTKLMQFHQFETDCTNLYTSASNAQFVHLIFTVHKFVHSLFVVHKFLHFLKNEVYKFVHPVAFPLHFSLKNHNYCCWNDSVLRKEFFWHSCWNVVSFMRKCDSNVDQKSIQFVSEHVSIKTHDYNLNSH